MEAMLEEQAHVIAELLADRDIPPLPPLPPPILQDPYKHLQTPSGFNQRKWIMEDMDAREVREDQWIGAISSIFGSYLRYRCAALASSQQNYTPTESATELDSHADSPVLGQNAIIIETTSKTVLVSGFTSDLGKPLRVPVVNSVVAYNWKFTGENYILVIYNALHMKSMEVNLIPPFMLRLSGLEVNECHKFLSKKPGLEHQHVFFPKDDIILPFKIEGIISYRPTRPPGTL